MAKESKGTLSTAVVQGLQGKPVSLNVPANGQSLVWNINQWHPGNPSALVGTIGQVGDFQVLLTSSTVLTIGLNCSPSAINFEPFVIIKVPCV